MAECGATTVWKRGDASFTDRRYSRGHRLLFDGGIEVPGSTTVVLHPEVRFGGERLPDRAEQEAMHREAHESCFIANSVRSEVRCEPVFATASE